MQPHLNSADSVANHDRQTSATQFHDRAPLWENIEQFRKHLKAPFYCPGHKGGRSLPVELLTDLASCDLNNLPDTDTLHCPTGSILHAEQLLADAYGVLRSFMLVGGSSLGNMAAVMSSVSPGDSILVQRNAHKSVIAGIIHSGAIPRWIVPTWDDRFGISHGLAVSDVAQAIASHPQSRALVALNPTYFGTVPDIQSLASLCHAHKLLLIADEAHGPHFRFGSNLPPPAENCGADLVVQSTHKILSGLSQAAVLHVCSPRVDQARVHATLQSLQTTSPNFAILASIDLARRQMVQEGGQRLQAIRELACEARESIERLGVTCLGDEHRYGPHTGFVDYDPTKLLIDTQNLGWTGTDVQQFLNQQFGVQPELAGASYVLCILTLGSVREDVTQLLYGLTALASQRSNRSQELSALIQQAGSTASRLPEMVMTPREAFYHTHRVVPVSQALGYIAGEIITPYPPGIPVLMPGERIDAGVLALLDSVKRLRCPISAVDPHFQSICVVP